MAEKKNILILFTSVGYGHKRIAENIGAALSETYNVDLKNLFDVEEGKLVDRGSAVYLWIVEYWPQLWAFFYTNKIFLAATLPFRRFAASFKSEKVARVLAQKHYDAVICTQVNASAILSYLKLKGIYTGKFIVTFSDFHLHHYWMFDNVDLYLANIPEQKEEMVRLGITPEKIAVCGITIPEKKEFDQAAVRKEFGVPEGKKVVLVIGGARGQGIDDRLISELSGIDALIVIICGRNEKLYAAMRVRWAGDPDRMVLPFIDNIEKWYSIADLIVTKPGGLTVTETLCYGAPILVWGLLPGQEEINYVYLRARHLIFPEYQNIKTAIVDELASGRFAAELRSNKNIAEIVQHGAPVRAAVDHILAGQTH